MHTLRGQCHCGNLELTMETSVQPEALPVRACGCTFCRRHCARTTSDPSGRVHIRVRAAEDLSRYRFGLQTADFLVCRRCGNYLAAVMSTAAGRSYATANINLMEAVPRFTQAAVAMSYEGETVAQRQARRVAKWTPVAALD